MENEELSCEKMSYRNSHLQTVESKEFYMDDMDGQRFEWEVLEEKIVREVDEKKVRVPLLLPRVVAKENRTDRISSSSSRDSPDIRRHTKDLRIYGKTPLCEITTCTYRYQGKKIKQHYVTAITRSTDIKGNTGLRLYDELLSVNGKRLKGKKHKKVIQIFMNIKPDRSGDIDLKLTLRCWKEQSPGPVRSTIITVRLNLVMKPEKVMNIMTNQSENRMIAHKELLSPGNVVNISFGSIRKVRFAILEPKTSSTGKLYLLASADGSMSVGNLSQRDHGNAKISEFKVMPFQGYDASVMPDIRPVFGYILYYEVEGNKMYMTSCFSDTSNRLVFKKLPDIDENLKNSPDERFFLLHANGDNKILESMLYRGECVHYKADSHTLNMQSLTIEQIKTMNEETCGDFIMDIFEYDSRPQLRRHLSTMATERIKWLQYFCVFSASET